MPRAKHCYRETTECRPEAGVSDDPNSVYCRPVTGKGLENGTHRVIKRLNPPPGKFTNIEKGEVIKCDKWLATNEAPHTKKFHHRFVVLKAKGAKLDPKKHPAMQMMIKLGQKPNKKKIGHFHLHQMQ